MYFKWEWGSQVRVHVHTWETGLRSGLSGALGAWSDIEDKSTEIMVLVVYLDQGGSTGHRVPTPVVTGTESLTRPTRPPDTLRDLG